MFQSKAIKYRGEFLSFTMLMYFVVIAILFAIGMGVFSAKDTAKVTATKTELEQIRTQVLHYRNLRIDNALPSSLGDLVKDESISSSDSIDGLSHGNFLETNSRWTESGLIDLWGNAYVLDDDAVYSTGGSSDTSKRISFSLGN